MKTRRTTLLVLIALAAALPAAAQRPPARLGIGAGYVKGANDLHDCAGSRLLTLPLGLAVGDTWRASLWARWYLALPGGCDDSLGREHGGVWLQGWSPAVVLEAQRVLRVEEWALAPGLGVGVVRREEPGRTWHPWRGGSLALRPPNSHVEARIEHGWYRVTYVLHPAFEPSSTDGLPRHPWVPVTTLSLVRGGCRCRGVRERSAADARRGW